MNDPAGRTRMLLSHNIQCILRRIPAVYIDRKLCLLCHFQLFDKPPFLNIMRFFIPIIIQTNFSDHDRLRLFAKLCQHPELLLIQTAHIIRMNSDPCINKRVFFRQLLTCKDALHRGSYVNNATDPMLLHRIKKFLPVAIKLFIIIMCMTIKNHRWFPFLALSLLIVPQFPRSMLPFFTV